MVLPSVQRAYSQGLRQLGTSRVAPGADRDGDPGGDLSEERRSGGAHDDVPRAAYARDGGGLATTVRPARTGAQSPTRLPTLERRIARRWRKVTVPATFLAPGFRCSFLVVPLPRWRSEPASPAPA